MEKITKKIFKKKTCQRTCKSAWKVIVAIFVLVSIFYGLVWIPSQQLQISQDQLKLSIAEFNFNNELAQLNITKIRNSCQIIAQNSLIDYEKKAGKLKEEDRVQMVNNLFANCLFSEGINIKNKEAVKENGQKTVNTVKEKTTEKAVIEEKTGK